MRHGYLLGYQHVTSLCLLLPVCASASPPILPDAQRCRPRAPAEFRDIGVEVNVTASLRISQYTCTCERPCPTSRKYHLHLRHRPPREKSSSSKDKHGNWTSRRAIQAIEIQCTNSVRKYNGRLSIHVDFPNRVVQRTSWYWPMSMAYRGDNTGSTFSDWRGRSLAEELPNIFGFKKCQIYPIRISFCFAFFCRAEPTIYVALLFSSILLYYY